MSQQHPQDLYLVALALGPVQDFIAAARRTRDLWFGSFLLSEISKAAACALHQQRGDHAEAGLIFPATEQPEVDLAPCESNLNEDGTPPFNVPNKLLAVIACQDPNAVIKQVKAAAQARWEGLAEAIFIRDRGINRARINQPVWDAQIADLLEIYAAWVRYDPQSGVQEYKDKRQRLERLLTARKNTRDFKASTVNGDRIAKSSLDGLRESVIDGTGLKNWQRQRCGLSAGEQLDCPGLVKRLGGEPEQFVPLSRIAVDPWLRNHCKPLPDMVKTLIGQLHEKELGLVSRVRRPAVDTGRPSGVTGFHYDGQLLYPARIQAARAQLSKAEDIDEKQEVIQLLEQLENALKPVFKDNGEPSPYVAILAADGDRMGEKINTAHTKDEHRQISLTLSGYAKDVAKIAQQHHGQLIYAGGDDVLMAVPLDCALSCARELADAFASLHWPQPTAAAQPTVQPTLSVGIGISHMLTPMGRQLALAREAEQAAKANQDPNPAERKNGLAILYQPRSGERIEFRAQWRSDPTQILARWQQLHHSGELPSRAAMQLRELVSAMQGWCKTGDALVEQEINRVLERKRLDNNEKVDSAAIGAICKRGRDIGLKRLAQELLLTQKLAAQTGYEAPLQKTQAQDARLQEGGA